MKILSGQGEILTIDPKQFSTELYCRLLYLAADDTKENVHIAKSCIEDLVLKRRKQVSVVQVTGFFKRLGTILLQMDANHALDYMLLLRTILQAHPKCDHLLDTDVCARGVFQPEVCDPEYCNAEATNLWELSLLRVHYDTQLNPVTANVAIGAPSQGTHALSHKFINRHSKSSAEDSEDFLFPEHIADNPPTKKCRHNNNLATWTDDEFRQLCTTTYDISSMLSEEQIHTFTPAKRKNENK
jgi:nucleolar complex protein 3